MSCNCGCRADEPPLTRWRRFVPLIAGVAIVAALIAGAKLKDRGKATAPGEVRVAQTSSAARF